MVPDATVADGATETQPLTVELRQKTRGLHLKMDRLVQLGLFTVLDYQVDRRTTGERERGDPTTRGPTAHASLWMSFIDLSSDPARFLLRVQDGGRGIREASEKFPRPSLGPARTFASPKEDRSF